MTYSVLLSCSSPTKSPTKPPTSAVSTVAATKSIPTINYAAQACPAAPTCTPMNCMPSCPIYCCKRSESPRPKPKDELIASGSNSCPSICYKRCAPICPRRCCGAHPGTQTPVAETRPNIHISDLTYGSNCPNICKDVCALECPHRCCGPGSFKKNQIPYAYRRSAIQQYGYNQYRAKKSVSPHFSTSYIRRFGYPKL